MISQLTLNESTVKTHTPTLSPVTKSVLHMQTVFIELNHQNHQYRIRVYILEELKYTYHSLRAMKTQTYTLIN